MRLEQLLWLAETIDQGTMHQAALNSFTSTQNISKALKSLETELGAPLLIRSNNGVTPTAEGRYVYEKAVDIRSSLEDLKKHFSLSPVQLDANLPNNVRIMSVSGMVERLRDIESHLVIEESSIGLTLYEFEAGHLNKIVFSNRESIYLNDFLFLQSDESELPRFESLSNLYDLYILCADSIGICFGKSSPYVSKTSITLKELRSIPLACFQSSEETRSLLFSVLCRFGSRDLPDPVHVSNSRRVCIDYVVRDTNIGFLCIIPDEISWELDSRHFEDRAIVPLKEKIKIYTIMACKKDSLLSPAASLFKKATLKHFEKTCYRFAQ